MFLYSSQAIEAYCCVQAFTTVTRHVLATSIFDLGRNPRATEKISLYFVICMDERQPPTLIATLFHSAISSLDYFGEPICLHGSHWLRKK